MIEIFDRCARSTIASRSSSNVLSRFNCDHAQFRFSGNPDCFHADHRHIETHVLIWFRHLDHDRAFARQRAAAFNRFVCSLEAFDCEHCPVFHDHSLSDVESRDFLGDFPAKIDIFLLATRKLRPGNQSDRGELNPQEMS